MAKAVGETQFRTILLRIRKNEEKETPNTNAVGTKSNLLCVDDAFVHVPCVFYIGYAMHFVVVPICHARLHDGPVFPLAVGCLPRATAVPATIKKPPA